MKGFFITISNGLLVDGHRKRMGAAVWEFMWLLDRITSITENGIGVVLGGRPIRLEELADDQVHINTTSRNLKTLEDQGYIQIVHAPYGLIITVNKANKVFAQKTEV